MVILHIFHFQFNQVPATIADVDFLGKLVVIADSVQCLNILKLFAEKWLPALGRPYKFDSSLSPNTVSKYSHIISSTSVREAAIWAYVSWRLSLDASFREATNCLVLTAKKPVDNFWLPFIPRILGRMLHICSFLLQ